MPEIPIAITLPGELVLSKLLDLILVIVEGQSPEVKAELWRLYLEDVKAWRRLWGLKD